MACLSCFCLFAMCILCMRLCMFRCVWVHMWVQVHPCGIQILILSVLLSQFPDLNPELNNLASLRRQLGTRFPCLCLLHLRVIDLQIVPWDPNCGPQVYMENTLPISPSPQPTHGICGSKSGLHTCAANSLPIESSPSPLLSS